MKGTHIEHSLLLFYIILFELKLHVYLLVSGLAWSWTFTNIYEEMNGLPLSKRTMNKMLIAWRCRNPSFSFLKCSIVILISVFGIFETSIRNGIDIFIWHLWNGWTYRTKQPNQQYVYWDRNTSADNSNEDLKANKTYVYMLKGKSTRMNFF